jgi:hypothetical protein
MPNEELLFIESLDSITNQLINQFANELSVINWGEMTMDHHIEQFMLSRVLLCYYSLMRKHALTSRWPAMDYSDYSLQRERAHQAIAQQWTSALSLSLSLKLRQTVSRPVCLGIKHPSGAYDQIFISVRNMEYV